MLYITPKNDAKKHQKIFLQILEKNDSESIIFLKKEKNNLFYKG